MSQYQASWIVDEDVGEDHDDDDDDDEDSDEDSDDNEMAQSVDDEDEVRGRNISYLYH